MYTTVSFLVSRLPELGDTRAWTLFEGRYSPILKRYFMHCGCGEHVARDLTQETLQRVAEGLSQKNFHPDQGRLRGWVKGIAHNVLRNHRRKRRPMTNLDEVNTRFWGDQEDEQAGAALQAAENRFDAIWVRGRLSALLRLACARFEPRDLRCYFWVEIRKVPIRETARRLGLSESAVYQKRRKVAKWLLAVGPQFISRWEK